MADADPAGGDPDAPSSRIPGFYKLPVEERVARVRAFADLSDEDAAALGDAMEATLPLDDADRLVENVVGTFPLPLGIATNFTVNGLDVLVPMAVEESSVIAGASHAAKVARAAGGFTAEADDPVMVGQVQLLDCDAKEAEAAVLDARDDLLREANEVSETLRRLDAGAFDLEVRALDETPAGPMTVVHLLVDVRDAMGANVVNSMCERLAPHLEALTGGRARLRILSNLADRRLARAEAVFPAEELGGADVVDGIVEAWAFAEADPHRAATHNKGVMNGVDAVVVATGNDWRAVEAGAHAYAARDGRYRPLTRFERTGDGDLRGEIELPLALGTVGGLTTAHPVARTCLRVLGCLGEGGARRLAEIVAAVGLAQNVAALRALAAEGIQAGHMALHAKNLAALAGAEGDEVDRVAETMVEEGEVSMSRARELVGKAD